MKKAALLLFFLTLLTEVILQGVGFWRLRGLNSVKTRPEASFRILVVGESTSHGILLKDRKKAYPFLVGKLLEKHLKKPVYVYNYSVPGNTSHRILEKFKERLSDARPHLVITHFGNNDFNPILNPFYALKDKTSVPYLFSKIKLIKFFLLWNKQRQYENYRIKISREGKQVSFVEEGTPGREKEVEIVSAQLLKNYSEVLSLSQKYAAQTVMVSYFETFLNNRRTLSVISKKMTTPLVDLHQESVDRKLLAKDLWHPSLLGHQYIAQLVFDEVVNQLTEREGALGNPEEYESSSSR